MDTVGIGINCVKEVSSPAYIRYSLNVFNLEVFILRRSNKRELNLHCS